MRLHFEVVREKVAFLDTLTKVMAGCIAATGKPTGVDVRAARGHVRNAINHLDGLDAMLAEEEDDGERGVPL